MAPARIPAWGFALGCALAVSACAVSPDAPSSASSSSASSSPAPSVAASVAAPAVDAAKTADATGDAGAASVVAAESAAPDVTASARSDLESDLGPDPGPDLTLAGYLKGLREASCPLGVSMSEPETIDLQAKPVSLSRIGARKSIGKLTYLGGFQLTSSDPRFGGLSGLDVLETGDLLAVSDTGALVWIDLADDGLTPLAARMAPLNGADGRPLDGKLEADAEGLAYQDGLALVSFERDHRVLAYDIGGCGAAARGAPIVVQGSGRSLPDAFAKAGLSVGANSGPEPLAVTPDWNLFVGLETRVGGKGPLSARALEGAPSFDLALGEGAPDFVGLDLAPAPDDEGDVVAYSLHRGFDNVLGNAIMIERTVFRRDLDQSNLPARIVNELNERSHVRFRGGESEVLASMGALAINVDNFEGIAATPEPGGGTRLYIISDNNFSGRQRTLLMAFEVAG
ncbi:MAG: esterase-like activity of phytase family protein [Hyphomonadaceae bacterium]